MRRRRRVPADAITAIGPFPALALERRVRRRAEGVAVQRAHRESRIPKGHSWPVVLAAALVLFVCYLRLSRTSPVSGDGSSIALEAWDMSHGNWLLHGWTLTDVSFYTTELPQYAAIEALHGLAPGVVHLAAAMTYTLLVLAAGWLAKGRATGRAGLLRFLIASGIMLSPQPQTGAFVLLLSPDHVGTMVPLLLIWLLLDRAPRRWWVAGAVGGALAWVQVGDRLATTVGVVPLVLVCGIRVYQGLVRRRDPMSAVRFELSLAAGALLSVPAAALALRLITKLHGFSSQPLPTVFAGSASWPGHLALTAEGVLALFGADPTGRKLGLMTALAVLHLVGAALAGWAVCRGIRRFGNHDIVTQVLAVAVVINVSAYVLSTLPQDFYSTRELAAVLPCGAVLAGRLLAERLTEARLIPAAGAVLLGYAVALAAGALQPAAPAVGQKLAGWLAVHHLSTGLASYADANPVTLASGGAIQLRQPDWHPGEAGRGLYASKTAWFDPRLHDANFVVSTNKNGPHFVISYKEARTVFGKPARTYHYDGYTIWIWRKNLLDDLRPVSQ